MNRFLTLTLSCLLFSAAVFAQNADKIVGIYHSIHQGEESKIKVFKEGDGTYTAQVIWVKNKFDKNGEVVKDEKNPDKSKRNTPCDEIVLIKGMKYDSKNDKWGETKIYDPVRGLKANVTCSFETDSKLKVRGSLLGFGETVYWNRIEE